MRMEPKDRKQQIITAAIELAEKHGYQNIKRDAIAEHAGVAAGLVNRYFDNMHMLRRYIIDEAIRTSNLTIIAQGLVAGDKKARATDESVKKRAMKYVTGK